jgi:hypothetical protein
MIERTGVCNNRSSLLEGPSDIGVEFGNARIRNDQVITRVEPFVAGIEWLIHINSLAGNLKLNDLLPIVQTVIPAR